MSDGLTVGRLQSGWAMKKAHERFGQISALKDALLKVQEIAEYEAPKYVVDTVSQEIYVIGDNGELKLLWNASGLLGDKSKEAYIDEFFDDFQNSFPTPSKPDIATLKKQLKHTKSYLEKVSLERQLNEAYKKKKRGKNGTRT